MYSNIYIATSIYPSENFDRFAHDFFHSLCHQTHKKFKCLFFLDCIDYSRIKHSIELLKQHNISFQFLQQKQNMLSPSQIRHLLIKEAKEYACDLLILLDFDEISDKYRIQKTVEQISDFDFAYNSFYPTDFNLIKISNIDFLSAISAPKVTERVEQILDLNYIGLGSLALKPKNFFLPQYPKTDILAYDWFLATQILLQNKKGIRIYDTFVSYRQHDFSYIGIGKPLDIKNLELGLKVKKIHYSYFCKLFPKIFHKKLQEILELEIFLEKNKQKYIRIINTHFNPSALSWWENIKTLEEIKEWI